MPERRSAQASLILPPALDTYDVDNERQTRRAIQDTVTQLSAALGTNLPWIEVVAQGSNQTTAIQGAIDTLAATVPTGSGDTVGGGIVLLSSPNYIAEGLVLKYGVHVVGLGQHATTIRPPATGSTATAVWLLNSGIVAYASLRSMSIIGRSIGTQHGIYFHAQETLQSGSTQGGWWSGALVNLAVSGFTGEGIWLHAGGDSFLAPIQFISLDHVEVDCPSTTKHALRMSGECNQVKCIGPCRFEGPGQATGGTCVLLERTVDSSGVNNGDLAPDIIEFDLASFQSNTRGMTIERAQNVTVSLCHLEGLSEGIYVDINASNVVIDHNDFANVGHIPTFLTGWCVKVNGGQAVVQNNAFAYSNAGLAPDTHYIRTGGSLQLIGVHQDASGVRTSGITAQLNVADPMDVTGYDTVYLNTSVTPITTITSSLPPGSLLTLKAHNGTITLASGGNIYFDSGGVQFVSPYVVTADTSVGLVRMDLQEHWHIVAGLPNGTAGTSASVADSKAVSAGTRASTADSKALSVSTSTSTADSKASSAGSAAAVADSKGVSAGTRASTADSKALSDSVLISNHESRMVSHGI